MKSEQDRQEPVSIESSQILDGFNQQTGLNIKRIDIRPDNNINLIKTVQPERGDLIEEPVGVELSTGELTSFTFMNLDGKQLPDDALENLRDIVKNAQT